MNTSYTVIDLHMDLGLPTAEANDFDSLQSAWNFLIERIDSLIDICQSVGIDTFDLEAERMELELLDPQPVAIDFQGEHIELMEAA